MKKFTLLVALLTLTLAGFAQEQPKHEYKWYVDENGRFYYNKHLPVYFWISSSPDENAPKHRLLSETSPQYSNPMYFDLEGYNTLRSPSAVDTVTKKTVIPQRDVRFEVWADGLPPKTSAYFKNAKRFVKGGNIYYGQGLEVPLKSHDNISGVEQIYYSVDGQAYTQYSKPLVFDKEQSNITLKYYAVDNVGNAEKPNEKKFNVDLTAPDVSYKIDGDMHDDVISHNAKIVLSANDNMSGVKQIYYIINGGKAIPYTGPIPALKYFKNKATIAFFAVDNVGNSNENEARKANNANFMRSLIADNTGPEVSLEILGDQYQGKYFFVSPRTQFKLTATDDLSAIDKIEYKINSTHYDQYSQPTNFKNKSGLQTLNYRAFDQFHNSSKIGTKVVYYDKTNPVTGITYGYPKFFHRDTLFIHKTTKVTLFSRDAESGVAKIEYSIDDGEFKPYTDKFTIPNEGYHKISFKATDKVNNVEVTKTSYAKVDNTPPEIYIKFSIEPIKEEMKDGKQYDVYPTYTKMFLSATDRYTGVDKIFFSINGGKEIRYTSADAIASMRLISKPGFYTVKVRATDKLGNESTTSTSFIISNQ